MIARILCVEDEPDLLTDLAFMLESAGYVVDSAADGTTAMAVMAQGSVHLVLCDVQLPDMTGLDLLRAVHDMPGVPPPFVMLTAFDDPEMRALAQDAGAMRLCTKPVDYLRLLSMLAEYFPGRGPNA